MSVNFAIDVAGFNHKFMVISGNSLGGSVRMLDFSSIRDDSKGITYSGQAQ